jgi:predicted phosphodiesterase
MLFPALLLAAWAAAASPDRAPYIVDADGASATLCRRDKGVDSCEKSADASLLLPGPAQPLLFAAFGDCGSGTSNQAAVAAALEKADPQLVLLLGDIVYPSGQDERYDDRYFAFYSRLAARRPFFPAVGNHDYGNTSHTERGRKRFESGYKKVFRRPPYYSFDAGPVHFASLDTNEAFRIGAAAPIGEGSAQYAWLDADLAASKARWKVLTMHVPLFASDGHGDMAYLRKTLLPLIKKHGVDLVLAGHDHFYERWKPVDGMLHLLAGTGGAHLYRPDARAPGLAKTIAAHGFILGKAEEKTLSLTFVGTDGKALDSVELRK